MHALSHALKMFVSKLLQNPDYYNIKHYSKLRRKFMRDEEKWQ